MFLQREEELELLNKDFNLPYASLEFIIAARNTGKTALISEYTKDKEYLYIANHEMISTHFFTSLANIISNYFDNQDCKFNFSNFIEVLEFLSKHKINKKLVIIFDDFQNIQKLDKTALFELLSFWNKCLKTKNIQLIISSSLLFENKELEKIEKTATNIIKLEYLSFSALKTFFPNVNKLDLLYIYSILGTSTTNLKYYNTQKSFSENIYNLFLSSNAYLFDYGIRVLKSEISDIGTYSSILYAISLGNTKIGDIASFLDIKSTYLSRYIQKLQDMMIIKKSIPLGEDTKRSKFGRYEIVDNTLNFWFLYIYPNLAKLKFSKVEDVSKLIEDDFISKTVFRNYKKCIKEYIFENKDTIFGFKPKTIGSWWDNTSTIDLIAYDNISITYVQILWEDKDMAKISYGKLKQNSEKFKSSLEKNFLIITKETFFNVL
ncbi:ATP-binding protein [Arcobacter roscoffensis]|uniref:ATPase n=1 Tax=Arcobacter roscoffensis TaxID=2961520 RepID=A0ABY5EAH2_9BACT|nr:DUF234 domain-containing protein [Arcobacter roscoffensis]UTJ07796.1 hypothetical protein NJU99_06780 [Arcobacter roscoffensis]